MRHAALDRDAEVRHVASANLIVLFWPRPDRLGEVLADLVGVDVERGRELDVADVVAAEVDVHEARDALRRVGVLVVLDALHEGRGAVADADDGDADLLVLVAAVAVRAGLVDVLVKFVNLRVRMPRRNRPRRGGVGYSAAPRASSRAHVEDALERR